MSNRVLIAFPLLCLISAASVAAEPHAPTVAPYLQTLGKTAEIRPFYELRSNKPVWAAGKDTPTETYTRFLSSLEDVIATHGLEPRPAKIDEAKALLAAPTPDDLLKIDVLFTSILFEIAHALDGDRASLGTLYPGWIFKKEKHDLVHGLSKAIETDTLAAYLADLAPKNKDYADLIDALKTYRQIEAKGGWGRIPAGESLKPGMSGPSIPLAYARLAAEGYLPEASGQPVSLFNETLAEAVKAYQLRNGLQPDGAIGPKTLTALNVPLRDRIDQIIANMERWRHLPDSFTPDAVMVNIADMTAVIHEKGTITYRGPVVIGRPDRKTPFIQSAIRSVIFNPAWHVPSKIAQNDILPKLRKDPHYLEKMGFVINGSGEDPHGTLIDWKKIKESEFNFRLRQSPGDGNSLGRLKFDFDNDFAVYMHGTPHLETFEKAERAQSSGCIRLKDPEKVAEVVLAGNDGNWGPEKIAAEIDSAKTKWIQLKKPLPITVLYWTVFQDETTKKPAFRKDIYDYDRFLIQALNEKL